MLISSHLLPDVETTCERVVIVSGGQAVAEGEIQELLRQGLNQLRIRIRGDEEAFAAALRERGLEVEARSGALHVPHREGVEDLLFAAALETGTQIRYLGMEARSLEEVFLQLVDRGAA